MQPSTRPRGLGVGAVCASILALVGPLAVSSPALATPKAPVPAAPLPAKPLPMAPAFSGNNLLSDAAPQVADVSKSPSNAAKSRLAAFRGDKIAVGKSVTFNLFPGLNLAGKVTSSSKVMDMRTWRGKLTNSDGYFYAAQSGDAFIAHVGTKKGVYEVSKVGDGVYRVIMMDQSKNKEDAPGTLKVGDLGPAANKAADDSRARIDVMVAYTPQALAGEGSLSALYARMSLAVAETNGSYLKAAVTTRIRLVHIEPVSYTESGDFQTDLNRVINPSDGYMDNVPKARNGYGADMVGLIIENTQYCGLASSILANSENAYMTASRTCTTGYYSFGHELGHLQGARHDVYVDPTNSPYSYGHGYVSVPGKWRTVMGYNNKCADAGVNCTRLQYFSNPHKSYGGRALGTSAAKNYTVLNNTATRTANFRAQVIGNDFSSTFNTSTSGWWAVDGPWKIKSKTYYTPGIAGSGVRPSIARNGVYGDLDYTVRMKRNAAASNTWANTVFVRGMPTAFDHWYPSYMFQYTNSGSVSIWRKNADGTETPLWNWTASGAVKQGAQYNVIRVVAVGTRMRMYVNGVAVATVSDAALRVGNVGVGYFKPAGDTTTMWVDSASLKTSATVALADARISAQDRPSGNKGTINQAPAK